MFSKLSKTTPSENMLPRNDFALALASPAGSPPARCACALRTEGRGGRHVTVERGWAGRLFLKAEEQEDCGSVQAAGHRAAGAGAGAGAPPGLLLPLLPRWGPRARSRAVRARLLFGRPARRGPLLWSDSAPTHDVIVCEGERPAYGRSGAPGAR